MLPVIAFYFFPAFRLLIPAHCLLCLLKASGLAIFSSAWYCSAGYCRCLPGYLQPFSPAEPPPRHFCRSARRLLNYRQLPGFAVQLAWFRKRCGFCFALHFLPGFQRAAEPIHYRERIIPLPFPAALVKVIRHKPIDDILTTRKHNPGTL